MEQENKKPKLTQTQINELRKARDEKRKKMEILREADRKRAIDAKLNRPKSNAAQLAKQARAAAAETRRNLAVELRGRRIAMETKRREENARKEKDLIERYRKQFNLSPDSEIFIDKKTGGIRVKAGSMVAATPKPQQPDPAQKPAEPIQPVQPVQPEPVQGPPEPKPEPGPAGPERKE